MNLFPSFEKLQTCLFPSIFCVKNISFNFNVSLLEKKNHVGNENCNQITPRGGLRNPNTSFSLKIQGKNREVKKYFFLHFTGNHRYLIRHTFALQYYKYAREGGREREREGGREFSLSPFERRKVMILISRYWEKEGVCVGPRKERTLERNCTFVS